MERRYSIPIDSQRQTFIYVRAFIEMGDSGYLAFEMEMICAATDATLLLMVVLPFQMVGKKEGNEGIN